MAKPAARRCQHTVIVMLVASMATVCWAGPKGSSAAPPVIEAAAAILVDAQNGQVLYEKNADLRRPPASTTKILTAALLIEKVAPETLIEADKEAAETDGSSLYMMPGEKIAASELVYALLMRSANDACVAVAKHIAGSEAAFAELMNERAAEIGATNSHFANPSGLHAPDHYSTARDLAVIARYAVRWPAFNEAARTRYHTIIRDPRNKDTFLKHRAKWLWHYPGADGIKTGYTVPAGRCFVGSATRKGWRLISVVLSSPDIYGETRKLMDYGFAAFEPVEVAVPQSLAVDVPVLNGRSRKVRAVATRRARVVALRGQEPALVYEPRWTPQRAPVAAGAQVGEATVRLVGAQGNAAGVSDAHSQVVVDRVPLAAVSAVDRIPDPPPPGPRWPRVAASILALAVFWYGSTLTKGAGTVGGRLTPSV